jgi:type IV secretion system protein VirB2
VIVALTYARLSERVLDYDRSLADPPGSSSILAATHWVEGTLLGNVATSIAVIAVAGVGFKALSGRVDIRRAITVLLGSFILFGAPSIVAGIEAVTRQAGLAPLPVASTATADPPVTKLPQRPDDYDPYAGAAVPQR